CFANGICRYRSWRIALEYVVVVLGVLLLKYVVDFGVVVFGVFITRVLQAMSPLESSFFVSSYWCLAGMCVGFGVSFWRCRYWSRYQATCVIIGAVRVLLSGHLARSHLFVFVEQFASSFCN
ncbi:14464_t:CDS:2, partial [Cetraspora pellucida]